ncbi:MAG: CDP-diacylglycerol--serine O-phosphatidyltransferase [Prevotellaceae bacterium]|jgi:CDP-diacylglycerol--serine O-phosphatidyltransferase|nr:CDP-diacylglycerol--serine O-phosphatidyltransferase [Prevotellaceae bacterium]
MNIKRHIPNAITCLNLFSGCVAVWLAFNGDFAGALLAVLVAAVFDFCDGLAARLLKAYSAMGKELDSLADVISFGFAPGAMIFSVLSTAQAPEILKFAGFIIPAFSALRLAKFNLDERQTSSFIGLPVPANAIFWGGLVYAFAGFLAANWWFLLCLTLISAFLLVCEIPMFSLKVKGLSYRDNKIQYIFIGGCLALLAILRTKSVAFFIVWYVLFSIVLNLSKKKRHLK